MHYSAGNASIICKITVKNINPEINSQLYSGKLGWMEQTPAPNHSAVNFHQNNVIPGHTWGNKYIEIENVCYLQHICL